MRETLNGKGGFTLIEIMLVVIIIGILAALVVPNYAGRSQEAKITAARADIEMGIANALDMFEIKNGHYPDSLSEIRDMVKKNKEFKDPWGNPYVYKPGDRAVHNKDTYDLYSLGPDGVDGTEDDICNWQ